MWYLHAFVLRAVHGFINHSWLFRYPGYPRSNLLLQIRSSGRLVPAEHAEAKQLDYTISGGKCQRNPNGWNFPISVRYCWFRCFLSQLRLKFLNVNQPLISRGATIHFRCFHPSNMKNMRNSNDPNIREINPKWWVVSFTQYSKNKSNHFTKWATKKNLLSIVLVAK